MIADDHDAFREACAKMLMGRYRIVAAVASGRKALEAVRLHDPDVLVLDLDLPDISGLDVAAELAARGARPRVVVLTLLRERAVADHALRSGVTGYVTKTRLARDLLPAIEAALNGFVFCSPLSIPPES